MDDVLDDECIGCGEEYPKNECPNSKRPCGHHCNHFDVSDNCHWCPAHIDDNGNYIGHDGEIWVDNASNA